MRDQDRFWDFNNVYRYRNENLARLGFKSYRAYLASALWKSIKARVFSERGAQCEKCRRPATQVHHRAYDPATLRGDDLRSLTATCARCHRRAERPNERQRPVDRLAHANKILTSGGARRKRWRKGEALAREYFEDSWGIEMAEQIRIARS